MKTGCYATCARLPGAISISRSAPRWFTGPAFRALAPGPWFNSVSRDEYERRYFAQLDALNAKVTIAALETLTGGAEPILLCFERPPFTESNWCHRRMVADWLAREVGITVDEVTSRG